MLVRSIIKLDALQALPGRHRVSGEQYEGHVVSDARDAWDLNLLWDDRCGYATGHILEFGLPGRGKAALVHEDGGISNLLTTVAA